MTETIWIGLVSVLLLIIQGLVAYYVASIRNEIRDIWKRLYNHYHEIECNNKDCAKVKTGNVVIPHEGA